MMNSTETLKLTVMKCTTLHTFIKAVAAMRAYLIHSGFEIMGIEN